MGPNDEVLSTRGGDQARVLAVALRHEEHLQGEAEAAAVGLGLPTNICENSQSKTIILSRKDRAIAIDIDTKNKD